MNDWIKLHRSLNENPLWLLEPFSKAHAWIDLCLNANWKKGSFSVRGNIINVERGQIAWSELTMADRWKWSRNKVRAFLALLEKTGNIVQQKTHLTTIITINNYNRYQSNNTTEGTTESTTEGTTEGQQKVHDIRKKERKKERIEEKNTVSDIEKIYQAYPKKADKGHAIKAIKSALLKTDFNTLLSSVEMYAEKWDGKDKQYCKNPATWFNGMCLSLIHISEPTRPY